MGVFRVVNAVAREIFATIGLTVVLVAVFFFATGGEVSVKHYNFETGTEE